MLAGHFATIFPQLRTSLYPDVSDEDELAMIRSDLYHLFAVFVLTKELESDPKMLEVSDKKLNPEQFKTLLSRLTDETLRARTQQFLQELEGNGRR